MNNINTRNFPKSLAVIIIVVLTGAILIWLNQDGFWSFLNFIRDREAVVAYLDPLGFWGPLLLSALLALQVLIPSLPSEPLMITSAYAYGFLGGFLISWLVAVAASQAVFYLARYAGRPLIERFVPVKVLDKWTMTAGEKGTIFFLLAFVIPPIPSDIMTYVAGLSAISGRQFLMANLIGRIPMVALFTLVGANGFTITPTLIAGLTVSGVLMLLAYYYFIVREQSDTKAHGGNFIFNHFSSLKKQLPIASRQSPLPARFSALPDRRPVTLAARPGWPQPEVAADWGNIDWPFNQYNLGYWFPREW